MILEAVTVKIKFCWDVTQCSLVDGNLRFPFFRVQFRPDKAVRRLDSVWAGEAGGIAGQVMDLWTSSRFLRKAGNC